MVAAATEFLRQRRVDLVVSNQNAALWCEALRANGYLSSSSNFALGTSPALTAQFAAADPQAARAHFNRGDGDGPIHL